MAGLTPLLRLNNVEVRYDRVILVLKGLSLEVPEAQIVTLLGANGAGKSTTLKAISGLLKSEDGEVCDGTIEFDVNTIGRGAPGIAFRQQDEGNFELLYLRPDPSCPAFRACIQYAPQTHGVLLGDLFPQYQTRAPLRENGDKNT